MEPSTCVGAAGRSQSPCGGPGEGLALDPGGEAADGAYLIHKLDSQPPVASGGCGGCGASAVRALSSKSHPFTPRPITFREREWQLQAPDPIRRAWSPVSSAPHSGLSIRTCSAREPGPHSQFNCSQAHLVTPKETVSLLRGGPPSHRVGLGAHLLGMIYWELRASYSARSLRLTY